ncbi:uncharacterized protein LOC131687443 [Topomyia yanbarensis]|uniref:uncharacterized protein LOC131687443 n=1 Tax=Topomyia yanbarensis TaxID=2498891 RepID=UPI00273A81BB|nr:uncharacterized protein LOC131687443 [Topomyia yanbarensis]
MVWIPENDIFVFDGLFKEEIQSLLDGNVTPTKRQVLRVVMSIFDPLGLVAPFVVHGKILVQNIWRSGISWDDRIPDELLAHWQRWTLLLQQLKEISISRCYFPGYDPRSYDDIELHTFVDASEDAYACVSYFRMVDRGEIRCSLVAAKTKVAPLKPLSIPKLELQAAVIGARMTKNIVENHTIKVKRQVMWTDSSTVLSWLRSDVRKYRQYVAFRVSEILDHTSVDEWRWVSSKWNVADDATKWGKGPRIDSNSRWFKAPEFINRLSEFWPDHVFPPAGTTEELRPVHAHRGIRMQQLLNFGRFSKWERLVRAVAYVYRFINILQRRVHGKSSETSKWLSREEILTAERTIWKQIQFEEYADEILVISMNQKLPLEKRERLDSNSKLIKLSPFLDDRGVLRMETRMATRSERNNKIITD